MNKDYCIGDILKEYRINRALSQQQVADALKIDRSTYSYYELNKTHPSLDTIVKLAKIFDVDVSSLLPDKDSSFELRDSQNLKVPPIYQLTKDEKALITKFRVLSKEKKKQVLDAVTNIINEED